MRIYDISRSVHPTTAVWPGDQPVQVEWTARIGEDASVVNVSALTMSVHAGTHVDAPHHYLEEGDTVEKIPLLQMIGHCLLTETKEGTQTILRTDLSTLEDPPPRILFKTKHSALPDSEWDTAFPAFAPDAIDYLGELGVVLIGTDAPSVDPYESKDLLAHKALARHGIANLENLSLAGVPPGRYELIALPLKVAGLDAAPVRAILLES